MARIHPLPGPCGLFAQDAGPRFHEAGGASLVAGDLEEGRVGRELFHERLIQPVEERLEVDGQALGEVPGGGAQENPDGDQGWC